MVHKGNTPCLHPRKEERRQQVQRALMQGWTHQCAWWDVEGPAQGQRRGGRCQRMEEVTGHGMKLGFYSKSSENNWKVLTEGRLILVYILKWSLWLPYGE